MTNRLLVTTLLAGATSTADFGDAGTYALTLSQQTTSGVDSVFLNGGLFAEVDYFVVHNLTLHVRAGASLLTRDGVSTVGVGPGLGVGYHVPLVENLGLLPKTFVTYQLWRTTHRGDFTRSDIDYTSS